MENSYLESRRSCMAEVLRKQGQDSHMTATDLETYLVCAIAARTNGRVQTLSVQVLGGRIVLHGIAGSYHSVQLAVAGLMETLDALGLDRPGRVDLNIDVVPKPPARPSAAECIVVES
ncbi:MAG: hypothetical protein ACYC0X_34585 [Pirellulaceae bacterium]